MNNWFTGTLSAAGGGGYGFGGAGTIYLKPDGAAGELRVAQEHRGEWTPLGPPVDRGDYVEFTVRSSDPFTAPPRLPAAGSAAPVKGAVTGQPGYSPGCFLQKQSLRG